jgi:hypothetical protein
MLHVSGDLQFASPHGRVSHVSRYSIYARGLWVMRPDPTLISFRVIVQDIVWREGDCFWEQYMKEEEEEMDIDLEEESFWIDDPVFEFRDFRRRP